jgi:hypothetical protein
MMKVNLRAGFHRFNACSYTQSTWYLFALICHTTYHWCQAPMIGFNINNDESQPSGWLSLVLIGHVLADWARTLFAIICHNLSLVPGPNDRFRDPNGVKYFSVGACSYVS